MRYEKETASSSDVTNTNEDTDEDESNHFIARSFDEPLSEDQDSVSDQNYVNATTELKNEGDIKPSANHKEVSYFNIFECGRNLLDKLNPYQRAFAASDKTSRSARMAFRNRVKEESPDVISAASPITSSHESPMAEKYWQEHDSILTERMIGKEKGSASICSSASYQTLVVYPDIKDLVDMCPNL